MSTNYDEKAKEVIKSSSDMLVPWYLLASYTYYIKDESILSDEFYDQICKDLYEQWFFINHRHKYLVDRETLKAGTAFHLKENDYPDRVKYSALKLLNDLKKS